MTFLNRIWANKNYRTSAVIAIIVAAWLASGAFVAPDDKIQAPDPSASLEPRELTKVRARQIHAQAYPMTVAVTAQTEANRFVDLQAEVGGQVEALPVDEGSKVEAGDVICRLAVEDRAQLLAEAQAMVEQRQIDFDGAQRLETGGFQSKTAIATAKAQLESAEANLLRRQIDLEKTAIRAPFSGIVDERPVEIGDLVRPGDTCATVIDLDPLVVSAEVSEREVVRIGTGELAEAQLATGEKVRGEVRYISRRANAATRSFRVEAAVANPDLSLMSGITAQMHIPVGTIPAHLISSSLLMLDDRGELGLRVVEDDNRVRFYNVELVGDAEDGIWVTGLPESTLLITVGQQYVDLDEQVAVSLEDARYQGKAAAMSAVK